MGNSFVDLLKMLVGKTVVKVERINGELAIHFSSEDKVSGTYWRLLGLTKTNLSSFDDGQIYGLSEKIDAIKIVQDVILNEAVVGVRFIKISGDLEFEFSNGRIIQIFNFSGNEVWEVEFHDGSGQLSNFV